VEILFRHASARYQIVIENPHGIGHGVARIELDGVLLDEPHVDLADDGRRHAIRVTLGEAAGVTPPS